MEPFLDGQGKKELSESLKKYPFSLQRHSRADQFMLCDQERKGGIASDPQVPDGLFAEPLARNVGVYLHLPPKGTRSISG